MTITFRPEHENLIAQAIETGAYQNPDEVIERAFGQFDRGEVLLSRGIASRHGKTQGGMVS